LDHYLVEHEKCSQNYDEYIKRLRLQYYEYLNGYKTAPIN